MARSKISKKRKSFKRNSFRKRNYSKKRRGGGNTFTGNKNVGPRNVGPSNVEMRSLEEDLGVIIPDNFDMPNLENLDYYQIRDMENSDNNIMSIKDKCLDLFIHKDYAEKLALLPKFRSLKTYGLFPINLPYYINDNDDKGADIDFRLSWLSPNFNLLSEAVDVYKKEEYFGNIWKSIYLVLSGKVPELQVNT